MVRIKDQIERGVGLTDRLNKFAHSTDETLSKIDLQDAIEQLVTLAQRFARLKHVVLKTMTPDHEGPPVTLVTRHVQLQMALFCESGMLFHCFVRRRGKLISGSLNLREKTRFT